MNSCRSILKISIISLGLLCNEALFGMKCNYNGSLVVNNKKITYKTSYDEIELPRTSDFGPYEVDHQQPQTFLPIEIVEATAACAHDNTKNAVKMTCKHLHRVVFIGNIMFVSNPLFIADEKKIHKIAIVNSWKQNIPMINALRRHLRDDIVTIPHYTQCDTHGTYIKGFAENFTVEYPGQLNKKYINGEISPYLAIKSEVDLAMYCAVLGNDTAAIEKLTPIIKHLYQHVNGYGRSAVQESLLNMAIKKGNTDAFGCIAQHDPYNVKNYHDMSFNSTYLDVLNHSGFRGTSQKEIDKYGTLYRKHGGKTYKELNPSCIIS